MSTKCFMVVILKTRLLKNPSKGGGTWRSFNTLWSPYKISKDTCKIFLLPQAGPYWESCVEVQNCWGSLKQKEHYKLVMKEIMTQKTWHNTTWFVCFFVSITTKTECSLHFFHTISRVQWRMNKDVFPTSNLPFDSFIYSQ